MTYRRPNWNGVAHFSFALFLVAAPAYVSAQPLPAYARGATPEQLLVLKETSASLQKRLKLTESTLDAICRIVGRKYGTRDFLRFLEEIKSKADMAGRLIVEISDLRQTIESVPRTPVRTDADNLLRQAKAAIDSGLLDEAQTILDRVVALSWGRSREDLDVWSKAITARAKIASVREGIDAGTRVIDEAIADNERRAVSDELILLMSKDDMYAEEFDSRPNKKVSSLRLDSLLIARSKINLPQYRKQYVDIEARLIDAYINSTFWDIGAWTKAQEALNAVSKSVSAEDGEIYFRYLFAANSVYYRRSEFAKAIDNLAIAEAHYRTINDLGNLTNTVYSRGTIYAQWAKSFDKNLIEKKKYLELALKETKEALFISRSLPYKYYSGMINEMVYSIALASCCDTGVTRIINMQSVVAELAKSSTFYSKSENPSSWFNVQVIIGSSYQALAAQRANLAYETENYNECTVALQEMVIAKEYVQRGLSYIKTLSPNSGSYKIYNERLAEIDSNIINISNVMRREGISFSNTK